MFFRYLEPPLREQEQLHRHARTPLLLQLQEPDKPYRSSNLGSFRTKA